MIDSYLDLDNHVNEFIDQMVPEDDAILYIRLNTTEGLGCTCIAATGNLENLSYFISEPGVFDMGENERYIQARNFLVNATLNICNKDKETKELLIKALSDL